MAKESTLQVRMDAQLKLEAEQLFRSLGTSFPEAVRIFARQSVLEQRMPFSIGHRQPTGMQAQKPIRMVSASGEDETQASAFGMLSQYAGPDKLELEQGAWLESAAKKHAANGGAS